MSQPRPSQPRPSQPAAPAAGDSRWAELADLILIIAREIQFRGYTDPRAIPLSQSEGMVMRYLHKEPAAPPSRIAAATGLQRTNLSPVLHGLERKGLIERHASPQDRRGMIIRATQRGTDNYALVRQEWASAVSSAADPDTSNLDTALAVLRAVETGLSAARPSTPGRPAKLM